MILLVWNSVSNFRSGLFEEGVVGIRNRLVGTHELAKKGTRTIHRPFTFESLTFSAVADLLRGRSINLHPLYIFMVTIALVASVAANASADDPKVGAATFIEGIGAAALKILQSEEISSDVRELHIRKLLQESVDLKTSARIVLGPNWKLATVEQRKEFETLFADYVLRIYPRALSEHGAEKFVITGWREMPGSDTLVYTRAVDAAGENFTWCWRVREINGGYKAIDLIWGGVSMTATLRAEFNSYIFDAGMNRLLEKLRSTE